MSDYRAPRGSRLSCANWQIEAAFRMVQNNLDPEVAEDPARLIVYGGSGKAARNPEALAGILATLQRLRPAETMLVQSGKCVGVFATHEDAPRVLIANGNLVGEWANWDEFRRLERLGLIMYGQMTAGSWIYIGSQGIVQGTYETFVAAGHKHFGGDLRGRLLVTAGLGGMGGAQPLAMTMAGGVCLAADVDRSRIEKRLRTRYLDELIDDPVRAIAAARKKAAAKEPWSIGVPCNATGLLAAVRDQGLVPDLLTDQTSAHDMLNGYVPDGMPLPKALELRARDPQAYLEAARNTCARHVSLMLDLQERGAITFDYGNNLRTEARAAGVAEAFRIPGFVPEDVRPLFCEGRGPFRWVALSGDPEDIARTDALVLEMFAANRSLATWIEKARQRIAFQGLPARICRLGYGERAAFAMAVNDLVAKGELRAPVVFGRDHLDCGSVASPNRETEAMRDGSDAIADWPLLNAMLNVAAGATWVSIHHGGGVGIGRSIHAGQVTVADGSLSARARLLRVQTCDPGTGIARHADAGYEDARNMARERGVDLGGRAARLPGDQVAALRLARSLPTPVPPQQQVPAPHGAIEESHVMASFRSRKTKPEGEQNPGLGEDMAVIVDRAANPYLVLFHDPAGFRAEQVRGLRNRLQAMNPDGDAKTLVVTSAARADGRTTTAINLAMALAELERHEVVPVDADLRHPGIERLLNLPPAPGLSDVLLGRVPLERALRPAGFRRLMLLGGGTKVENPAEVMSGSRIDEIYARLKERFQYVVVDTPPALASTDAGMLAARADGTLIVLRLEHTTRGHAKDAFRNLQDLGANVLGSFVIEVRGADPEADRRLGYHDGEDLP